MKKDKVEKWIGHKVFDSKTGEGKWERKRNQKTKDYRRKPLTGEHLRTPRRNWEKGFKRLAHNFARKIKQFRRNERKERNKVKRGR
jgi:hypothetical protein